jgi:hypothetical protein
MAAVATTVHNRLGKRFYSLPMSPPKALAEGRWGMAWLHDYASHGRKRIGDASDRRGIVFRPVAR